MTQLTSVEKHPKRDQIIKALIDGKTQAAVSKQFRIDRKALWFYIKQRLAPKVAEARAERERAAGRALDDRIWELTDSVQGMLGSIQQDYVRAKEEIANASTLNDVLMAKAKVDRGLLVAFVKELRECYNLLARMTGKIKPDGEVNLTINMNKQVAIVIQAVQEGTKGYPEIKSKIMTALEKLEAGEANHDGGNS